MRTSRRHQICATGICAYRSCRRRLGRLLLYFLPQRGGSSLRISSVGPRSTFSRNSLCLNGFCFFFIFRSASFLSVETEPLCAIIYKYTLSAPSKFVCWRRRNGKLFLPPTAIGVNWSVCKQHYAKTTQQIFPKFGRKVTRGSRRKRLHFGGNPDLDSDQVIFEGILSLQLLLFLVPKASSISRTYKKLVFRSFFIYFVIS